MNCFLKDIDIYIIILSLLFISARRLENEKMEMNMLSRRVKYIDFPDNGNEYLF